MAEGKSPAWAMPAKVQMQIRLTRFHAVAISAVVKDQVKA